MGHGHKSAFGGLENDRRAELTVDSRDETAPAKDIQSSPSNDCPGFTSEFNPLYHTEPCIDKGREDKGTVEDRSTRTVNVVIEASVLESLLCNDVTHTKQCTRSYHSGLQGISY